MADLAQLVKARLTFLVLLTTAVGFYVGLAGTDGFCRALSMPSSGPPSPPRAPRRSINGGNTKFDAIMVRTRMRPIPAGRMSPREGLIVGTHPGRWRRHLSGRRRELDQRASGRGDHRHLPFRLHAAETNQHREHACRRDPGRAPAADRLGRGAERSRPARLDVSLRFCFSGNCRTFLPSAGCIAKIMRGPVSSCSPVVMRKADAPDGRAFSSRCSCSSRASHRFGLESHRSLSADRALVRRAFPRARISLSTAPHSADGATSVSWLDHLPAASPRRPRPDETMSSASVSLRPGRRFPERARLESNTHPHPAPDRGRPLLPSPNGSRTSRQPRSCPKTASFRHFNSPIRMVSPLVRSNCAAKSGSRTSFTRPARVLAR